MCAAVTHYDRQENTILLDKSGTNIYLISQQKTYFSL